MTDFVTIAKERLIHEERLSNLLKKKRELDWEIEIEKAHVKDLNNDPEFYFKVKDVLERLIAEQKQIIKAS